MPSGGATGPLQGGAEVTVTNPQAMYLPSVIDSGNSTSTPLAGGATFTGSFTDVLGFTQIVVRVEADVVGTCFIEFSTDGINVLGNPVQVNDNDQTSVFQLGDLTPTVEYYRLRYVNGSSAQSSFTLSSRLNRVAGTLTNSATQRVDDYARVLLTRQITDPFLDEVSGKQANRSAVQKFGSNPNVGAGTAELITELGTSFGGFLMSAKTVRVKAGGQAQDNASTGTGARTVIVEGLDENWEEASETLSTNGASASSATTTTFIRVNRAYVATSGTYSTDGVAKSAGDITIEASDGSADLIVIRQTIGQSQQAIYSVPLGKIAYIRAIAGSSATGKTDGRLRLMQRQGADIVSAPFTSPRIVYPVLAFTQYVQRDFKTYLGPFPAKTDLYFIGVGPTGGSEMSADMDIVLVDA